MANVLHFKGTQTTFFLVALMSEFMNRLQTVGNAVLGEVSWKQCILLTCIRMFDRPPTIGEISRALGNSHQNVKQMLVKLQNSGYVELASDSRDRRRLRVNLTEKGQDFIRYSGGPDGMLLSELFQGVDRDKVADVIRMTGYPARRLVRTRSIRRSAAP